MASETIHIHIKLFEADQSTTRIMLNSLSGIHYGIGAISRWI